MCEGVAGRVFQGLQMLGLGMAGGRATVSAFMQDWRVAGLTMLAAMPILAVILVCVAPLVRRESTLGLLKSEANQP